MNAPLTRRALLGATAAIGAAGLPAAASALAYPVPGPDAALLDMIGRWAVVFGAWDALDEATEPLRARYDALAPERPATLNERFGDDFGVGRAVETLANGRKRGHYGPQQIEAMRSLPPPTRRRWDSEPAPWGNGEEIMRPVDLQDPPRAARLAEILAAHDAWQAERDAVRDRVGLSAALLELSEAADLVAALEDDILSFVPTTLGGFQAKARWIAASPQPEDWAETLLRDLVGAVS